MEFHTYTSPEEVLRKVETCLMKKEAENNLPLSILSNLSQNPCTTNELLFAIGMESDGFVLIIESSSGNLVLCGSEAYVKNAASWLYQSKKKVKIIRGCQPFVNLFIQAYKETACIESNLTINQTIFRLDQLEDILRSNGRLCFATEDDIALITMWSQYFHRESGIVFSKKELEHFVTDEIKRNRFFIWRNSRGTPVTMAKRANETKNGVAINYVYTPDECRSQGYAITCVAALTERLLLEGYKFCTLYTNDDVPKGNLFEKVGYKPIAVYSQYSIR
ncbi:MULTISPECIES: GNAT family N-acetyltransferase [Bacillaceae]|uniref:N-acetyltransferase domain-containing protein n=1 Tax=Evansella alkalicola TaxID=745819 RepID=A0ABS6JQF3_9BACI|nr:MULTISPECIES: GNAT family N-acetyltransferase [Bacillaceae]MBU9720793.1 hypothetical protein [Bacillus alkalicola]